MSAIDRIRENWLKSLEKTNNSKWFTRLAKGEMTVEHYKSFLRETYYNAGQNPQIQAFSTVFFPQSYRKIIKRYYQHAIAEIGHDVLALNDLKDLGVAEEDVIQTAALPETTALIAYGYYSVQFKSPLDYLGYLFHLEFMPTTGGKDYINALKAVGVPESALSFLIEHSEVDIEHNKMMKLYIDKFVENEQDIEIVSKSAAITCKLHSNMIFAAFDRAEKSDEEEYLKAS